MIKREPDYCFNENVGNIMKQSFKANSTGIFLIATVYLSVIFGQIVRLY